MISPTESLAFSMHANPGVYAVLVGSGLSRAAQIPTGWEITLDLIRKLAALRKERPQPDPERWYRITFGSEPDYSELLDQLCGTPAERQQLLRAYWEPSAQEREDGLKQPTEAHHAIAALAADGFVRVILTTNFDRLIETALENAGVRPDVLSRPGDVRGAPPLVHMRCCVIKARRLSRHTHQKHPHRARPLSQEVRPSAGPHLRRVRPRRLWMVGGVGQRSAQGAVPRPLGALHDVLGGARRSD